MGNRNIERLKEKVGFTSDSEGVDKYFELIDKIYYEEEVYVEDFNEDIEVSTWFFEDGRRISLNTDELVNLALFLLDLHRDADEQLMSLEELEKSY
jgi:hypothetical protein